MSDDLFDAKGLQPYVDQMPRDPMVHELMNREHVGKKPSAMWPMLAALAGGAGDVISTQRNLARGGRELNPMLPQGRLANGLALGGEYAGMALLTHLLNKMGHDKLAKAVGYGTGIDGGVFTAHNVGAFKFPGER